MFISRKRWNEMERRVAELEEQSVLKTVIVNEMKGALESAVDNAAYHFKYSLAAALISGPSSRFSTAQKRPLEDRR